MLIFVTGGVRSGKSSFAEKLAIERSQANRLNYIATSMQTDKEMIERIHRHQERRDASNVVWVTWEIERNIGHVQEQIEQNNVILFDCLTTLVNNELFKLDDEEYNFLNENERSQLFHSIIDAFQQLQQNRTLIVVSNEIFYDLSKAEHETTFVYVEMLGKLHQTLVKQADEAYLCENGIPIRMK